MFQTRTACQNGPTWGVIKGFWTKVLDILPRLFAGTERRVGVLKGKHLYIINRTNMIQFCLIAVVAFFSLFFYAAAKFHKVATLVHR